MAPACAQWRDLETLYGNEEVAGLGGGRTTIEQGRYVDSGISTNKFRGFTYNIDLRVEEVYKVVKRHPSLLKCVNPFHSLIAT